MTDKERILQTIKEHDGWGIYELCQALDLDMRLVSDITRELRAEGRIRYTDNIKPVDVTPGKPISKTLTDERR